MRYRAAWLVAVVALVAVSERLPEAATPQLIFGTFLGGSGNSTDQMLGVDTDADGNAYVVGMTDGADFPSTVKVGPGGGSDAIVAKFAPDGRLIYAARIGGTGFDSASKVAVRSDGIVYVIGETTSSDFPVRDAFQPNFGGTSDLFVIELNREGNAVTHGTYLGGSDGDSPGGLELTRPLDASVLDQTRVTIFGDLLFVFGTTKSPNFPTVNPTQGQRTGETDGFLTVFDRSTLRPRFSSYAGLEGENRADGLILNHRRGDAYLWLWRGDDGVPGFAHFVPGPKASRGSYGPLGEYSGEDFSNSAFMRFLDEGNGIPEEVRRRMRYAAKAKACALKEILTEDPQGRHHVKPGNAATTLPVVSPVQGSHAGGGEGFVLSVDAATNTITFFSYLGGSNFDTPNGIQNDGRGNLWIAGETLSSDFPVTRSGIQPEMRGRIDGFVVKITK